MSEVKKRDMRYLAKLKTILTKNGPIQKIYIESTDPTNKDGTPNKYYKGNLIWADAVTGRNYIVKQMSFWVPKDGMSPDNIKNGFSHFITLNLEDEYEVTLMA